MNDTILNADSPAHEILTDKTSPQFTRTDVICALLMLLAGYLCIKLALSGGQGLGVTIFTLLFAAVLLYWSRANGLRLTAESIIYLGLILLMAAYFSLYDNELLKGFAMLLLPLLTGYFIATVSGIRLKERLGEYLLFDLGDTLLARAFSNISAGPRILVASMKSSTNGRSALLLLLGLLLAIPACFVVSSLLADADAAFSALWQRLTGTFLYDIIDTLLQIIISLPLACYFFAVLYGAKKPRRNIESAHRFAQAARFLPGLLVIGGITPLLLIYVIFFFSQTAYLLSAFSGLLPEGYVYSEYARRGFFELCMVSGINFAAIFTLMFLSKKTAGKELLYRVYNVLLSLFSIALIVISLRKMLLYIQIYGLTPLRVYTSWFMILLMLIFAFVIVKTTCHPNFNAIKWSAIAAISMFLVLCFANPDMQIARYNVRGYAKGCLQTLDVEMLDDLGDAATPYLLEITKMEQAEATDKTTAQVILNNRAHAPQQDWRGFNLTSWRAYELLRDTI